MIGVALIGMPFLYQSGDKDFHLEMVRLGLHRGSPVLCGEREKIIWANNHEYFLVDCDSPEEFCNRYKLTPTYTVKEFVETIKNKLEEENERNSV